MAAVTVFQLIDRSAGGLGEELVAHADAHAGTHGGAGEELADILHGFRAGVGVARAVGQEEAVELELVEVVVPGHADDFHAAAEEAADDVVLHAAVHEHHLLQALAFVVAYDFLARYLGHVVHAGILGFGHVVGLVVEEDFAHHHAVLTQHLGKFAGVDAGDAGHFFAFEPVGQTFHGVPVAVFLAVVAHDDGGGIDAVALHKGGEAVGLHAEGGHAVVAYEGIGQRHELSRIRGVGKAFGITRHCRVENDFAGHGSFIAKALAVKLGSIVQKKSYVAHCI